MTTAFSQSTEGVCVCDAQVIPQRTLEEDAVLGNESQSSSKDIETHVGDVPSIDLDHTLLHVDDPEERLKEGTLASAGSPHDADLLSNVS